MSAQARRWGWIALAALLCAALLSFCVRIVPADAPSAAQAVHHEASAPVTNGPLLIPVEGVPASALTDTYTQSRAGGARAHDAIDIMAARGRAVIAVAPGRLEKLFWSEAGGRTIYQRSEDGQRIYYYAHLDAYVPGLREGQSIRRGQVIATVGSTGNADPSAPHLHFAVQEMAPGEHWYQGRPINPYPLLARAR
jgi:murein DD-endopeptidase MepM/ murein hydrolase activator NlpD